MKKKKGLTTDASYTLFLAISKRYDDNTLGITSISFVLRCLEYYLVPFRKLGYLVFVPYSLSRGQAIYQIDVQEKAQVESRVK